jgi:hypothetical protein
MKILIKIECFLIGWNPKILENCKENSYAVLKKYVAAVSILSIIWGVIGWCFADNYLGINSWYGKIITSVIFIAIIVLLERYIILTLGKLTVLKVFRFILAVLMAVLGSTVFDQIVFKNDIMVQMKEIRTAQINAEIPERTIELDKQIKDISAIIDTLSNTNAALYEELEEKPTISISEVTSTRRQIGKDSIGNPIYENDRTIARRAVTNPKAEQAQQNEKLLGEYREREKMLQDKRLNVATEVRNEYEQEETGFLEELAALYTLLGNNPFVLVFYIFLFLFLVCLEILVITTKGNDKCDYELLLEFQLKMREKELE